MQFVKLCVAPLLIAVLCSPAQAIEPSAEAQIVTEAGQVLREIMAIPVRSIPRKLLANARGLVIVPGLLRGGFIVGIGCLSFCQGKRVLARAMVAVHGS